MSGMSWMSDWGTLTKEWLIGAFCAGTIDWISSKIPLQNGILAILLSTAQLATTVTLVSALASMFGEKTQEQFIVNNWFLYNVVWTMSPTAVRRLTSTYAKYHRIFYGSEPLPKQVLTATSSNCADGKCS